jgi:hypothetical protein
MLNYSPLDTLHTATRLSTMETLLARYQVAREQRAQDERSASPLATPPETAR